MRHFRLFLTLSLLTLNHYAAAAVDKDTQLTLDVQRAEFADSFETLLVGEREVIVAVAESDTPMSNGAAILIGESGENPFSLHGLARVADQLNQYGWVTLTVPAPTSGFFEQPLTADENATEPLTEPAAADTEAASGELAAPHPKSGQQILSERLFEQHQQDMTLLMQAVLQRAQDYPGFVLVIARGTSAGWLTKLYAEQVLPAPDGFVAIGAYFPERQYNQQIPGWMAMTEMPVLDVYSPWSSRWSSQTVQARRIQAVKQLKLHYRQRELIGQAVDEQQYGYLAKEIYGWTTYLGW